VITDPWASKKGLHVMIYVHTKADLLKLPYPEIIREEREKFGWEYIPDKFEDIPEDASLEEYHGGQICIVEHIEDLLQVTDFDNVSIIDGPITADSMELTPDGQWLVAFFGVNDCGGLVYYIPMKFQYLAYLKESLKLTEEYWEECRIQNERVIKELSK